MERNQAAYYFEQIAMLLDLKGENPFKVRAYSQAARAVKTYNGDLDSLARHNGLSSIKGLGKSTISKLEELLETGRIQYLDELRQSFPSSFRELLRVPGLGPKRLKIIHHELKVTDPAQLEQACLESKVAGLKGFGPKIQTQILEGLELLKKYRGKHLWADVEPWALALMDELSGLESVGRVEAAGAYRRLKEFVERLTLVIETENHNDVKTALEKRADVFELKQNRDGRINFHLESGLQVEIILAPAPSFPMALHHHTGSGKHTAALQEHATKSGLLLNDKNLTDRRCRRLEIKDEAELFKNLNLSFIPPELREGDGEVEAAAKGELPELIRNSDLKGIIHVHTTYSDGVMTVSEIVETCRKLGYEYVGISDHSQSAFYAGGLTEDDVKRQIEEIERARAEYPDITIFHGMESDILVSGDLDYSESILELFDFVIASVHSGFHLPEKAMTRRLIRAVKNPYTTILGHPTGRLLLEREPYALDLPAVLHAAAECGTAVEINANPRRLDLDWREIRAASALGIKIVICPDAHHPEGMLHSRYGINIARKGWLTKKDVLNCLGKDEMASYFLNKKNSAGQ